ncbi:MAG: thioredoxin domain-containing protein [Thermodesulfobacteriota bacterium]
MNHCRLASLALFFLLLPAVALARVDAEVLHTIKTETPPRDLASSTDGQWLYVLTEGGRVQVYNADGTLNDVIRVDPAMDRISVAGFTGAGVDDKVYVSSSKTAAVQALSVSFAMPIDTTGAPFVGPANAPVEIVVFSDFECPYCGQVGPLLEQVLEHNPKNVRIVFKHFPLGFHKNARPAAMAAIAAQKQGKFWEMHDRLFANQKNLTLEKFRALAKELKLNPGQFDRDLGSAETAQQLEKDINDGRRAAVRGTPTLFVNGRRVKDRDAALIQKMINEELKGRKQ